MILIGLGSVYGGTRYQIGSLARMGPGFFPSAVGAILALIGLAIALTARPIVEEPGARVPLDWRGSICIVGGMLAFIVLAEYGGLVPATFAVVFISAMGDRQNTVKQAFCLAVGMVVIAVVVFRWALHLQLNLFQWG